jgi:hypothetical protein
MDSAAPVRFTHPAQVSITSAHRQMDGRICVCACVQGRRSFVCCLLDSLEKGGVRSYIGSRLYWPLCSRMRRAAAGRGLSISFVPSRHK